MSLPINGAASVFSFSGATQATTASHTLVFDKTGYDYANIYLLVGTHITSEGNLETIKLVEHSSTTVATNMTDIVAFNGGTETSSSVGFVIPADSITGESTVIEFQVDLRKREKKIALIATNSLSTMVFSSFAVLSRGDESKDTAALKSTVTIHSNTDVTNVAKIVTG